MSKISLTHRLITCFQKLGEALKKSKANGIVLIENPDNKQTGMILMGNPDDVTVLLYTAMKQNNDIRAVIFSAAEFYSNEVKAQLEKEKPKSRLILDKQDIIK